MSETSKLPTGLIFQSLTLGIKCLPADCGFTLEFNFATNFKLKFHILDDGTFPSGCGCFSCRIFQKTFYVMLLHQYIPD